MSKVRVTSRDIAKAAKVSPTAVSFAINGKPGISDDTRKHILHVMKKMEFRPPNLVQKNLNIALLFRNDLKDFDQLFYIELNMSIIEECKEMPYNLIMASIHRDSYSITFSDILLSDLISGIIVLGDMENDILLELKQLRKPFVVLDSSRQVSDHYAVRIDYGTAAYKAANYLIKMGHKDIGYIGTHSAQDFNLLIFSGFQKAMTKNHHTLPMNRIQFGVTDEDSLHLCIEKAIAGDKPPTALFCSSDYYAILTINYLHALGLRVPEDISVIGIDDIAISKYMIPALTTVKIDREEIGRKGFELCRKLIDGEECKSVCLNDFSVIIRESVAPPRV